jgi:excisionase family DNA binding protein
MGQSRELLRASDLTALLGVSRSRVYQLIAEGAIPSVRRGRAIRIPRAAWERWLSAQTEEALAGLRTEPGEGADT